MSEVQRGKARYYGIASTVTPVASGSGNQSGYGSSTFNIVRYTFSATAEKLTFKSGQDGLPETNIYHGHMEELQMDVEFYADTIATTDETVNLIPSSGATLTVVDTSHTKIAGAWEVQSASITAVVDGIATASITCSRPVGGALTLVTT